MLGKRTYTDYSSGQGNNNDNKQSGHTAKKLRRQKPEPTQPSGLYSPYAFLGNITTQYHNDGNDFSSDSFAESKNIADSEASQSVMWPGFYEISISESDKLQLITIFEKYFNKFTIHAEGREISINFREAMPRQWKAALTFIPQSDKGILVKTALEPEGWELLGALARLLKDEDILLVFKLLKINITLSDKSDAVEQFEFNLQSANAFEQSLPPLMNFQIEKISDYLPDKLKTNTFSACIEFCDMGEIKIANGSDSAHILHVRGAATCLIIIACAYQNDEYQKVAAITHSDLTGICISEKLTEMFGDQYKWKYYIAGGTPDVYELLVDIYEELKSHGEVIGNLTCCNIDELYFDVKENKILGKEKCLLAPQDTSTISEVTTVDCSNSLSENTLMSPRR
jgi:hypothetical protein